MLRKGSVPQAGDLVSPEEEIKDPLMLEFLDLKDEYSEFDLEEALIHRLEDFLPELGVTSRSLGGRSGCGSATSGLGSTSCSSIAVCGACW